MKDYSLMISANPVDYRSAEREIAANVRALGGRVVDAGVLDDGAGQWVNFQVPDVAELFRRPAMSAMVDNFRMTLLGFDGLAR